MPKGSALLAVCFVAGLLGALFASLFLWFGDEWGLMELLNVRISQPLSLSALYEPLFIGGLWGLPYFMTVGSPRSRCHWIRKALWFSLIPALVAIFYVYPQVKNLGIGGTSLGMLMPGVVLVYYLIWGFFTGFFTRLLWGR